VPYNEEGESQSAFVSIRVFAPPNFVHHLPMFTGNFSILLGGGGGLAKVSSTLTTQVRTHLTTDLVLKIVVNTYANRQFLDFLGRGGGLKVNVSAN